MVKARKAGKGAEEEATPAALPLESFLPPGASASQRASQNQELLTKGERNEIWLVQLPKTVDFDSLKTLQLSWEPSAASCPCSVKDVPHTLVQASLHSRVATSMMVVTPCTPEHSSSSMCPITRQLLLLPGGQPVVGQQGDERVREVNGAGSQGSGRGMERGPGEQQTPQQVEEVSGSGGGGQGAKGNGKGGKGDEEKQRTSVASPEGGRRREEGDGGDGYLLGTQAAAVAGGETTEKEKKQKKKRRNTEGGGKGRDGAGPEAGGVVEEHAEKTKESEKRSVGRDLKEGQKEEDGGGEKEIKKGKKKKKREDED